MRKRLAASIALIGAAFFVAYLSGVLGKRDQVPERPFDPVAWRQGDRRERGSMTADLERSARLIGRRKGEVLDLLGAPTASDTAGFALSYTVDLGLRTGPWGMGGPWLFHTAVHFDSTSHLVNAVSTRD
jgi:hypothetical protein